MSLVPCPACNRHVRADLVRCAFCDATLEAVSERAMPTERLGRAALAAFGVTAVAAAAAVAACGDNSTNTVVKSPTPDADGGPVPQELRRHPGGGGQNMPYGAPPANGLIKRIV